MKLAYKHLIALIYIVVLFLDRLDLTISNVTLPTIARVFHVSIIAPDWVNLSFLLALAISIPISAWLGERFGYKKIYIIAMLLFGLGSTLCAFSPTFGALIAFRFIHGIGGGMLIPVGMTMIYRIYDKSEYAHITSFTFLPSLVAPAIAPFLGGLLLDNFSWHVVFLFSGPICLILTIISAIYLIEEHQRAIKPLDWIGFIVSSSILIDIFYFLSSLAKDGFSSITIMSLAAVILLTMFFIYWEKRVPYPLINLKFFNNEVFIKVNFVQLCFQACHFGAIFLVGMYLQVGIGLSASLAGLIMGMQAVGAMVTSRYSVKLFNHYGAKFPITLGLAGIAISSPCILIIQGDMIIFALLLFFVRGIFSGLCGTPIQTLSVISFSKDDIGSVNTIFNACRQISISFGIAISSLLIAWGLRLAHLNGISYIPQHAVSKVFSLGFFVIPFIAGIGVFIAQGLQSDIVSNILDLRSSNSGRS